VRRVQSAQTLPGSSWTFLNLAGYYIPGVSQTFPDLPFVLTAHSLLLRSSSFLEGPVRKLSWNKPATQRLPRARLRLSLQLNTSWTPPNMSTMMRSRSSALFPTGDKPFCCSCFLKVATWGNQKALAFLMPLKVDVVQWPTNEVLKSS
jgi:hypothetical protein